MARENPGTWRKEKQNPNARKRRWWDLGAHINTAGNLEIYRGPDERYLKSGENKCLVLRQGDSGTDPEVLEIINEGSGNPIAVRDEAGGTIGAHLTAAGSWTDASSVELKTGFQNMSDKVAEKQIEKLSPQTFTFKKTGARAFGLTAENFKQVTGLGDGHSISATTLAGLSIRYIQLLHRKIKALESQLAGTNPAPTESATEE